MRERERPTPSFWVTAAFSLLLAATPPGPASAQTPDSLPSNTPAPDPAGDAYLDETARRLVLGLKAARDTARLTIDAYTALIRERMGAEMPSYERNRPWVHGERTARVRWSRDEPAVVHVLGARYRDPLFDPDDSEFFEGVRAEQFAADPLGDPFKFGFMVLGPSPDTEVATRSPLGPASERYYQFRSGDTSTVRLSDGSTVRAVAVTVIPRYSSIRLVSAIMWIDAESLGLARVAYRLAKPVDREMNWHLRDGGRWSPGLSIDIGPRDSAVGAVAVGPGRLVQELDAPTWNQQDLGGEPIGVLAVLAPAPGLQLARDVHKTALLRMLVEHVDEPVLEGDAAVPLGAVDPLARLLVDVRLVGGDAHVRHASAGGEVVDSNVVAQAADHLSPVQSERHDSSPLHPD